MSVACSAKSGRFLNRQCIARVALDVPVDSLFDFAAEALTSADIGKLAVVPFGRRKMIGVVVEVSDSTDVPSGKLKSIEAVLQDVPALTTHALELARFCAGYYHHPLGQVLLGTLPPALRRADAGNVLRSLATRYVALASDGDHIKPDELPKNAVAQRRILELLRAGPLADIHLREALPRGRAALKALIEKGWVATTMRPATLTSLDARAYAGLPPPYVPHAGQRAAITALQSALGTFHALLLFGVTGSGKSEVYLHVIASALQLGRQVLVLVPEINLTPQLEARFRDRFPAVPLAALHSHAPAKARLQAWLAAQSGRARIVLGTRLAVFSPMPELGLIIVDEEHDASFKQQDGLRYSARDVAVYRARLASCPVVLGSATPSLESWANAHPDADDAAAASRYQLAELPMRAVPDATLPKVQFINEAHAPAKDGLTAPLLAAIKQRLARGEQSLIFLNRRGFSPALVCAQCAWMPDCPHCSARLVFHRAQRRLRCHHCGYTGPVPAHCDKCGSVDLAPLGEGTQRVEEKLAEHFPAARIERIDRDALRARGAAERIFASAAKGEIDILVGTQILAKGHDFPKLTLVGVLNSDAAMFSADFRAPERLFAQLVQVAGRAGRAGLAGEVLIQTRFPDHPLYAAAQSQDFARFAELQLLERRVAQLPPFVALALLRVEGRKAGEALTFARRAARLANAKLDGVRVHDAVPAALERKAGWERAQVMVQSRSRATLQKFIAAWRLEIVATAPRALRWAIDIDPAEV